MIISAAVKRTGQGQKKARTGLPSAPKETRRQGKTGVVPGETLIRRPSLAECYRNEDPRILTLNKQRNGLAGLGDKLLQLLGIFHRRVIDCDDDVARAHTGPGSGSADVLNHNAAFDVGPALLVG